MSSYIKIQGETAANTLTSLSSYISNPEAEIATTGWATYADAAGNVPVDGTGGTATGLTFSRSTSSPLSGSGQFSIVQTNSTSLQGKGVSYDFTISAADKAKVLTVSFDYNASSTFIASNGTTAPLQDGTTTTNAGNSDIEVFLYDVTNSVLIPISPNTITANGSNNFKFSGTFQTASNSTSYRFILHCATTSANATGYTFLFDNVYVGTQKTINGSPITDWTSFTPTGTWSTNTTYTGAYKRIGDTIYVWNKLALAGAPTSATLTVNLPSGLTIDTTKINTSVRNILGQCMVFDTSASANFNGDVVYSTSTVVKPINFSVSGANVDNTSITQAVPMTFASGDEINFWYSVPISGWASTTTMSNDTDTRIVAAIYKTLSSTTITSGTILKFNTVTQDTHSGYVTSTGIYTVPVSGDYQVSVSGINLVSGSADINVFVNGGSRVAGAGTAVSSTRCTSYCIVSVVAGDTITISPGSSVTASDTGGTLCISRISGPATIAATDTVAADYYLSANTSTTGQINFDTKVIDTMGSVTTGAGAWKFVAPISGLYLVCSTAYSGGSANVHMYKNGAAYCGMSGTTTGAPAQGQRMIRLLAGEYIDIRTSATVTYTGGTGTSQNTYISINRVGN